MAKFALSQPAGFEFHHQSVDLSATTPLPNTYYFAFCHADSASKTRSLDYVGSSDGNGWSVGARSQSALNFWGVTLDPPPDGDMIGAQASHSSTSRLRKGKAQVPPYCQQDDLRFKLPPL